MALGFNLAGELGKALKGSGRRKRHYDVAVPYAPTAKGKHAEVMANREKLRGHVFRGYTTSSGFDPGTILSALGNLGGSPVGSSSNPVRSLATDEAKNLLEVAKANYQGIKPLVHAPNEKEVRAAAAITAPVPISDAASLTDALRSIKAGEKAAQDSGAVRTALRGAAKKAEPDFVRTARQAATKRAEALPTSVKVAGKVGGKAATYPVKHPFTAPLALQAPAALIHGDPKEFLKGFEGKGLEASIANDASHVLPLAGEAVNLPATVLPSLYLTGRAGINAAKGNSEELDNLKKQYLATGLLPALASGNLSEAAKRFGERPIYSGLEASGLASAIGRGAGIAARSLPGDVGSVDNRPLVSIEGTPTKVDRGRLSPDLIRQYFPHFGQRSRDRRVTSIAPDTRQGKHFLKEAINRETVGNRAVEVMRNREALKALKDILPRKGPTLRVRGRTVGKLDRKSADVVGLAVERLFHDPGTFAKDLPAYKRMIEEAAQARDTNGNLVLGPEELKRNKENVKILERATKVGPHRVEATVAAANAFIELQKPILAQMVKLKLITHDQALMASAVPYARIHMGATHGEPLKLYFDLERQHREVRGAFKGEARAALAGHMESHQTAKSRLAYAESGWVQAERSLATARAKLKDTLANRKTEKGQARVMKRLEQAEAIRDAAKQRVAAAEGEIRQTGGALQTEARRLKKVRAQKLSPIEAQLKQAHAHGPRLLDEHGYPLPIEDIHAHMREHGTTNPGFISQREPTPGIHYQPNYGGAILEKGSRTGATALAGTHLFNIEGLAGTLKRSIGLVSRAEAWNHVITHFGTVLRGAETLGEVKKALKNPEAHGLDPRADMVIVPRYPFAAKKPEIEGALEHQDPTAAEDIGAKVVHDALAEALAGKGGNLDLANANLPDDTPVALIPRTQAEQLLAEAAPSPHALKVAQSVTNVFKRAVLPFSPNFYLGNGFDNAMRTVLAGVNPAHLYFGAKAERALTAEDKAKLAQGAFFSSVDVLAPHRTTENVVTGADGVSKAIRTFAEWSRKHGTKQAVVKAAPFILREFTHYMLATNAYVTEVLPQRGVIGKAAIADWRATGHSLATAAGHVQEIADNYAKGVASDPAKLVRAQKDIEQVLGNYSRMSPAARKVISNVIPFWTWTRAAYKFVYLTMPAHHPIETAFLAATARATQLEREDSGLDKQGDRPLPAWAQGGIPLPSGSVLNLNSVNSFPFASNPIQAFGSAPLAQIRAPFEALLGVQGWKGSTLPGGEGDHLLAAGEAVLSSVLPGWNLLTEEDEGKRKFAPHINLLPKTYPKSEVEHLREPTQTITVPASGSSSSSSSGVSGYMQSLNGGGGVDSGVAGYMKGLGQ
jgi:hypothetical protein